MQKGLDILHFKKLPWLTTLVILPSLGLLLTVIFFPHISFIARLRWLDSGICAQLPTHSFYPGGERLPLCSRNTGIYTGFIVTLFTLYATGHGRAQRLPEWSIVVVLVGCIVALTIDGFNSFLLDLGISHLYQPHNLLRLATGLATGLALAALLLPMLNRLFWRDYSKQRSIASWRALLLFTPALLLCFFATTSQSTLILYPISLLSTSGVLTALGSLNLIALVALSRRDETFERYRELLPFFGLAVLLAIGELLLLAQVRTILFQALGLPLV